MKKILYVYAPAGPPLDYCFPKIAARGAVHTCIISRPSPYNLAILQRHSDRVSDFTSFMPADALQQVAELARETRPDAVFTFSEFLIKSVSELAAELGVRGVGPNIELARNKVLMRQRWQKAGIPQPEFRAISGPEGLERVADLRFPVLIKLAYGAGSIGQQIVRDMREVDHAVSRLLEATNWARRAGKNEFSEHSGFPQLIAEEIIEATTQAWYDDEGYGDYLSVEGLVRDGQYHPLAMTGRLRTIEPFTELGNVAPCMLRPDKKRKIVELVRSAIDALQLENCATHTELKLMANGGVAFLETAARMGGVAIAKELDSVFGIDYVNLFLGVILGEQERIPPFEESAPRCAAASVALIGCDSHGKPWCQAKAFMPDAVDWQELVGGRAEVFIQQAQSVDPGSPVLPYDSAGGLLNYAGQAFLVSPIPSHLMAAAYALIDGLEARLPRQA
jgi:biotin carboxylase